MPEPCKFPSLDSRQKRFLGTHSKVDLAPHPVVGLVLQVGNAEKFPQALCFESLDPFFFFFQSQQAESMFHSRRGGRRLTRDLYSLNLFAKLMVLHRQILFSLAIAATAGAILVQTSAEQVPSLRANPRYLKLITPSNF